MRYDTGRSSFDVEDGNGYPAKITTGSDGYASLSGLLAGIYYIKEVIAPEGYELDPTQYEVVVPEGGGARIDIENDPIEEPTPPTE